MGRDQSSEAALSDVGPRMLALAREELPALLLAIVATLLLGMGSIWIWEFVAPGALGTGGGA